MWAHYLLTVVASILLINNIIPLANGSPSDGLLIYKPPLDVSTERKDMRFEDPVELKLKGTFSLIIVKKKSIRKKIPRKNEKKHTNIILLNRSNFNDSHTYKGKPSYGPSNRYPGIPGRTLQEQHAAISLLSRSPKHDD